MAKLIVHSWNGRFIPQQKVDF